MGNPEGKVPFVADDGAMRVSFVIPAWNEEVELPETLESLLAAAQDALGPSDAAPGWEVVVVDDASTDRTAEVARAGGARVVAGEWRQISRVRNAGAEAAHGEQLVFIDADTRVDGALLVAAFQAFDAGAAGGGARIRFDAELPLNKRIPALGFLWLFNLAGFAGGCFLFVRRAEFEAVGGFRGDLYASEEVAFAKALKKRGRFVVLREEVVSSARKLVDYSFWEILRAVSGMALRGPWAFKSRKGLDVWYGARR